MGFSLAQFYRTIKNAVNAADADSHDLINLAQRETFKTYGDHVSVFNKGKSIHKFGSRAILANGVEATIWSGTDEFETYLDANGIDTLSSDNVNNEQLVSIEGHTIDGEGDFTFVVQTATLDGQNQVTLDTPLARISRIANISADDFVAGSVIYAYENGSAPGGVPQTLRQFIWNFLEMETRV